MSTLAIPQTSTTPWNIYPANATAEFKVKHMMIANVKGHFSKVTGVLVHDESDRTKSHVEATMEAASIETRESQRDAHLKSADFSMWRSSQPCRSSPPTSKLPATENKGRRRPTIRGVTRKVTFAVEGPTPPTKDP